MQLTESQKKHLRGLAHSKKPTVKVGHQGLTESVGKEISAALESQELIKINVRVSDRDKRDVIIAEIVEGQGCSLVHRIGNAATLFKRNSQNPKIVLKD